MDKSRFHIFKAVIAAYSFVGREWRYLLGIGLLPTSVSFLTAVFTQSQRPDATLVEDFLWTLPTVTLFGWLMFQQVRLMIFGERIDVLPKDPAALHTRRQDMRLSVILWMLVNMAFMAVAIYLFWASNPANTGGNNVFSVIGMVLIGAMFWGVRFAVVHILAAVGYPIRLYIYRVNGIMISLRLMGMGLLAMMPMVFILRGALALLLPTLATDPAAAASISGTKFMAIALISSFVSLAMTLVLNAAAVFALKEILGREGTRAGVIA